MVYGPHNFIFKLFPIFFLAVFGLAIGIIVASLVQNGKKNRQNNAAPRLTSEATVVTKRTHVWGDHSRTDYYVTFQFESAGQIVSEYGGETGVQVTYANENTVSTIGAGDSTIAGFLAATYQGKAVAQCLQTAVAYGTAACLTPGTLPPRPEDFHEIYTQVSVKEVM